MEVALVAREAVPRMNWTRQEENGSLQTSVPGVPHLQTQCTAVGIYITGSDLIWKPARETHLVIL